jgi:hypothetical protein
MEEPMISRVWHGWTTAEDADTYEALLRSKIFPGIIAKKIAGFERIELFRREAELAGDRGRRHGHA